MSKLINGNFAWSYASIGGSTNLTSDMVMDIGTGGNNLTADIAYIESHLGGGTSESLTGDIIIGTTNVNTITINSGQTIYNNNEVIKVKDNSVASIRLQFNDTGPTDLMILNTTNGAESMYLPLQYTEIGNVTNGGVQIGDGSNAGSTNLYGIVSLKNATDSTNYSSVNCSNVAGGLSVYKKLNVGGSINSAGSINAGGAITAMGNINAYTNTIYGGGIILTGALNIGANTITCGTINSSGTITCGSLTPLSLVLPTTGGTGASLNYYESNFNFPMMFQAAGGGGTTTTVNLTISRIGNIVNIIMPIVNINSNGSYIVTNSAYYLPTRFRPSAIYIDYCMHSMNIATYIETGMINVCATGCINICKSSSSVSFGIGTGSGTANVFHMVYSI